MPRLSKIGAAALAAFGWTGLSSVTASYLQVAGGGGGGSGDLGSVGGSGGGAGGYLTGTTTLNPTQSYTVVVGAGGAGGVYSGGSGQNGSQGSNSQFDVLTASVGGGAGVYNLSGGGGGNGGSGGGGSFGGSGGTATSGQGNNGGTGSTSLDCRGSGGGGGASAVGSNGSSAGGGNGGNGTASSITGTSVTYAGGGGGGALYRGGGFTVPTVATGGTGGGGNSGTGTGGNGNPGTANLGGGGGGPVSIGAGTFDRGGNGGSGVVIISYVGAQQFGGGVVTSSGGNTIHTFTTSGTLSPLSSLTASYLIVAGGGGGSSSSGGGGGGGAGGLLSGSSLTIDTNSIYAVTVGAGGAGGLASIISDGSAGSNSSFSMVSTSAVGGGQGVAQGVGGNGGSGGGAGDGNNAGVLAGGTATSGQGNNGGSSANQTGGGGGGAGAVGGNGNASGNAGNGGNGTASSISGSSVTYAGGGGGGQNTAVGTGAGTGGSGGGGNGGRGAAGANATGNGSGGGGGGRQSGVQNFDGGAGGSGVVIISYAGSTQLMAGGTVTVAGGNVIHTFTSSGYLTPIVLVNNSLRFRSSASAYLNRTPASATNRTTWTYSYWFKGINTTGSVDYWALSAFSDGSNYTAIRHRYPSDIDVLSFNGGSAVSNVKTAALFRDPAAWYHMVIVFDTSNATQADRIQIYQNGVRCPVQSSPTYPGSGSPTGWVNSTAIHYIGRQSTEYFEGYMAEIHLIDGQALTPNSFGYYSDLGVWQPIRYGGSYGTNGFYLPFTGGSSYYGSFNGSSQYLQATLPATLTGAFTLEFYLYRSGTGNQFCFTLGDSNTSTGLEYYIGTTGTVNNVYSVSTQISTSSNVPVANAWNHVAITRDSSNVVRLFVNGVQAGSTWTTTAAFSNTLRMGVEFFSGSILGYVNGGLSNFRVINGTALYTSNFAPPTSALTAVSGTAILTLQSSTIIDNSGNSLSITNNGTVVTSQAYPFTMLGNQSKDYSPQGNNWTNNNIGVLAGSTLDIMTDVPTNTSATTANYCVLNPLDNVGLTVSGGNLNLSLATATWYSMRASMAFPSTGKYYWEHTVLTGYNIVGILNASGSIAANQYVYTNQYGYGWQSVDFTKGNNNVTSNYGSAASNGDVLMLAFDADNRSLFLGKNGTWFDSSNPATNTSPMYSSIPTTETFFPASALYATATSATNFGQRPFAYTPPTGFVALNTFNLPTPTILDGDQYMNVVTRTFTGASATVSSLNFRPDFLWFKNRTSAASHSLYDYLRGTNSRLLSNGTNAQITTTSAELTSFNSNGFTVGADGGNLSINGPSGDAGVVWAWNAGSGTSVSNTQGTITSTVSANTTAGFSVVTWVHSSTTSTIGHGLGVAPTFIILKSRTTAYNWDVGCTSIGWGNRLNLNTTDAAYSPAFWNSTAPTSTVFTYAGSGATNGDNMVAYCFAPIAGYSAFGSYTGNGSTDGTFVFTGFRPRWILIKVSSGGTGSWILYDTARNTYNVSQNILYPNLSNAEATTSSANLDILSNGFKLRTSNADFNGNTFTYIYACFAENPFKYANAR